MCVCACVCVFRQYFLVEAYLLKYYRKPLSTYFCFDPFKSMYSCFDIRLELAYNFSVFNLFPNTFVPLSGHLQWVEVRISQKYSTAFYLYWCNFLKFSIWQQ